MCSAWRSARSHEIAPSPPPANAPCRWLIRVCIIAGSMFMPDSRESCSASSSSPPPPSSCRSSSWNSSSGLRSSSATSAASQTRLRRAFYASRTHCSHSPAETPSPYAGRERPGRRAPVALFDENVTITPPPRRRMTRGTLAGIWALAIALIVLLVMTFLPTSYVIQQPGPVYNTLGTATGADGTQVPLISVEGADTYPTDGSLDLLTVQLAGNRENTPSWPELATAWFDPSKAVLP